MSTATIPESGTPAAAARAEAPSPRPATAAPFPYLDLKAQFKSIRAEVMEAVNRVMESQHFILGPEVDAFEREIGAFIGASHAVSCASGSDALLLALLALGVGPGDEVITTPFTFVATGGAIARVGAAPVFVDVRPDTLNLDPDLFAEAINPRTRAVIPVHLFGLAADLDPITQAARARNVAVIEDAAQALGAMYKGVPAGRLGTMACFSFFPSKNLGGAGDGGLVTTEDASLAGRLRLLRVHGNRTKYCSELLGTNSRLDALQAAILRVKLRHLEEWTERRRQRAQFYRALFVQYRLEKAITLPPAPSDCRHVYNQFVIRCQERDRLRDFLRDRGIPTEVYYPVPLHLQPTFGYLGYQAGQLPRAEAASRQVLALPIFPELTDEQQTAVVSTIATFYA